MEGFYRQKIIMRGAFFLGLFFILLIGGASYLFINTGHSIVERLIKEEKRYASGIIELKSKELISELEQKISSNLTTLSHLIAGFLYNYETDAINEALTPYFNLSEVVSLELVELPHEKSTMRMMKEYYDGTETYGALESSIVYNGTTLGRLVVEYSNKEIYKKAYEQNRAMEKRQELIQERVTETAYGQMRRYALYFGLGLLSVMGGVLWVLLYLDREVSRKSDALEAINNELEERVEEEIRKNRDKEQMMIEQSKMAAMGEMIGAIAHQWRQPLNALGLYIQDLEDAHRYNELDTQYLQTMIHDSMRQINFMSKTIDDFRNFFKPSKVEQHFAVRESLDDVLRLIGAQLESHHIRQISVSGGEDINPVKGFKNEFEQVILNILTNAKDAFLDETEKGFDVGEAHIDIAIAEKNGTITIEIKDNAGGIDESVIGRVFEPYFTTKEQGKGTGIGLYMSKTIIEKSMNGSIDVENIQMGSRKGAKFTITLDAEEGLGDA